MLELGSLIYTRKGNVNVYEINRPIISLFAKLAKIENTYQVTSDSLLRQAK